MSMSTHVVGVRPKDEKWEEMEAVYIACQNAGIQTPEKVDEFFNYGDPTEMDGLVVDMDDHESVSKYYDGACGEQGYTIEIDKVPKDVKFVRVVNSW